MRKSTIEKVIDEIKENLGFLFEEGFVIISSMYDEQCFGNWIVVLQAERCLSKLINDRNQISVLFAPAHDTGTDINLTEFADLEFFIAHIEGRDFLPRISDIQKMDVQYQLLSEKLHQYLDQVVEIVNSKNYSEIKLEFVRINTNTWEKYYPKLMGRMINKTGRKL